MCKWIYMAFKTEYIFKKNILTSKTINTTYYFEITS